jgi:hypothetical protein
MKVVISSGHSKYVRGARGNPVPPQLDEVDQARRVVEQVASVMRTMGVDTTTYHDDVSHSQNENLNRIVDFHNSKTRDLDVSVHFNAYDGSAHGTEVLWVSSKGQTVAKKVCDAICTAANFTNRGDKQRTDLFFLNNTEAVSVLIETCFCDNTPDSQIYSAKFNDICDAIAESISGQEIEPGPDPTPEPEPIEGEEIIKAMASKSAIASYQWKDRGRAPTGYIQGFALTWAEVVQRFEKGDPAVLEMAKKNQLDPDNDVLSWYGTEYHNLGMSNAVDGIDTLRHLYALLLGLGMRESSGKHCCGRDQSANNTDGNTCEAGLYQTSYNAHTCSEHFDPLMDDYDAGRHEGYRDVFSQGVTCSSADWKSYGSGRGKHFQELCKEEPAFAVESAALVLRNRRGHYGPIVRREAELKQESDWLLLNIQRYVQGEGAET